MTDDSKAPPKWTDQLFSLVHKNWQYHSPSVAINNKVEHDKAQNIWHLKAAPVYQEIYGGNEDGKKVWAGFVFDVGDFAKEDGIWVQDYAVASYCRDCTEHPKMMIKGKFKGHNFFLHIFLEPVPETGISEIVDVLKKEIREYPEEASND